MVGAEAYLRFFADTLVPELGKIEGHRGAQVLVRPVADQVEITVLTFWDSMQAVARFAGASPEQAVVEPEARALIDAVDVTVVDFDTEVRHLTLRVDTRGNPQPRRA